MKKTLYILIIFTILSKIIGLTREIILAYYFGATYVSDAYLVANTIPIVIFSFLGQAISTGYIPIYVKIKKEHNENKAHLFTSNLISLLVILSFILFLIGLIFTKQIVLVFASGFKGETLKLAIKLTRISLFSVVLLSIINVYLAFLRIKARYLIVTLIGLPLNSVLIISIYLSYKINILFLGIGILFSFFAQLVFLSIFVRKEKYRYKPVLDIKDNSLKLIINLAIPIIIGVAVNDINKIIDRTIASKIVVGGVSTLSYANNLKWLVIGITVSTITTILYPVISNLISENNINKLKKVISESITSVFLLIIPATIGLMVLSEPIIKLIFGRGAFTSNDVIQTSKILFYYSFGMIGVGLREILVRPFYAFHDMKTPMINSSLGMFLNIILNIVLSRKMGLSGIALATSIASIITAILMYISLYKKIGSLNMKENIISFVKILISSILMGILTMLLYNQLLNITTLNISLFISIFIGFFSYLIAIYLLKVDDIRLIISGLRKKIGK